MLDVKVTRAIRSAECWTDRILIRSKLTLVTPKVNKMKAYPSRRFDVKRLAANPEIQASLIQGLIHTLPASDESFPDVELHWKTLTDGLLRTAEGTIGFKKRHHQDWFDENDVEISELLSKKNKSLRCMAS